MIALFKKSLCTNRLLFHDFRKPQKYSRQLKKREEHEKDYKSVRNIHTTDTYLNFLSSNLEEKRDKHTKTKQIVDEVFVNTVFVNPEMCNRKHLRALF